MYLKTKFIGIDKTPQSGTKNDSMVEKCRSAIVSWQVVFSRFKICFEGDSIP